jgi:hypothetical protein
MKPFWKLLSRIYCELNIGGVNFPPPQILFNKTKRQLDCNVTEYILADINFTEQERKIILQAIYDLEMFCNGFIKLNINFELDSNDSQMIEDHCVLIRADGYHPSIVASDLAISSTTLGLCEYMSKGTRRLYLVIERLKHPITFRTTAVHELGHFIGLDHTERPSIMHKSNFCDVLYPTYVDAKELAKVWNIDPECLRYFKL